MFNRRGEPYYDDHLEGVSEASWSRQKYHVGAHVFASVALAESEFVTPNS